MLFPSHGLTQGPAGDSHRLSGPCSLESTVSVSVRDARISVFDRRWIESVYREYLDDLAPLNTGIFPVLGEVGHREPDQLARWFADSSARILTICKSSAPVGFAMVVPGRPIPGRTAADFHMAEFFIARAHRRLGIGQGAVELILDRFAGRWEVLEYLRNPGAVRFWRYVVAKYTNGDYEERVANGEVRQT
ncbi:MAG: GNAT family N-acetyltransferase, partial [Steroidobacteraceae bacterium]